MNSDGFQTLDVMDVCYACAGVHGESSLVRCKCDGLVVGAWRRILGWHARDGKMVGDEATTDGAKHVCAGRGNG